MGSQPTRPEAEHPGLGATVGLAAAMGLTAGIVLGLRDGAQAVLHSGSFPRTLPGMLALMSKAVLSHGIASASLAALAGAGVWIALRTRGRRLSNAGAFALAAAVVAAAFLPAALAYEANYPEGGLGSVYAALDVGLISALCAVGLGTMVHMASRRAGHAGLFAAGGLALAVGVFVLVTWGIWARMGRMADLGRAGTLRYPAVVLLAAGAAGGVYLLSRLALGPRMRRTRRRGLAGAGLIFASGAALLAAPLVLALEPETANEKPAGRGKSAPGGRPNVLWIVMDTTRADALSCYGYSRQTTPHIDQVALEGTLYERAFSAAGWTFPSHASMFTGLLPGRHGGTAENMYLDESLTTIAEVLASEGYRTSCCSANWYVAPPHNTTQGFQRCVVQLVGEGAEPSLLGGRIRSALRLSDYGAARANRLVEGWVDESLASSQPFFIFINYMEVHNDYGSTPYWRRWLQAPGQGQAALDTPQDYLAYAVDPTSGTSEGFKLLRALYDGDLTYLDERVGELVDYLRQRGILDDTVLILTSDHGEELGEHGIINHAYEVYNTLLHVPLIIRYPAKFAPGARRAGLVQTIDLFPTLLDLLGIEWQGAIPLDGHSLLGDAPQQGKRYAFAERDISLLWLDELLARQRETWKGIKRVRRLKTIQDDSYKYVWASDGKHELFDLRTDPGEMRNVIDALPEKARELRAVLDARVGGLDRGASAASAAAARRAKPPSAH